MVNRNMKNELRLIVFVGIASKLVAANLIVDQVPASVLANTNDTWVVRPPIESTRPVISKPERWEKFEVEFGIQQPSPSLLKGSLQNAKYQLDVASVTLPDFVDTVRDRLKFDYGLTDSSHPIARRAAPNNLFDTLNRARLQSAIDVNFGAKAFIGVKLVLPLGD